MDAAEFAVAFDDLKFDIKLFGHVDIGLHFPEPGKGIGDDDIPAICQGVATFGFAFGVGVTKPADVKFIEALTVDHEHVGFQM